MDDYVQALCAEIEITSRSIDNLSDYEVQTIYLGGGTPSLLSQEAIARLLSTINQNYPLREKPEMTLEVNPGTVTPSYLNALYNIGVNRLSIGVQSANQSELDTLDRLHGYSEAEKAVKWAREAGFKNLSLDLIYGIPGQSLETWQESVKKVLALNPEHFSLYGLSVEENTPLEARIFAGMIHKPDPDLAADMYEWVMEYLAKVGYRHYEISNWAKEKEEGSYWFSEHNRYYWLMSPYLGFGAGAHGFWGGFQTVNERFPQKYIRKVNSGADWGSFPPGPASVENNLVDMQDEIEDVMIMGLRLLQEGVTEDRFFSRFERKIYDIYKREIDHLQEKGLVTWDGECLRLSEKGYLLGNQVFVEFMH